MSALLAWCRHGWTSVAKLPSRVVKTRGSALFTREKTYWVPSSGTFPPAGAGRFSMQRCGTVRVSTVEARWSGLSRDETYSSRSTPPLGYWNVWMGANKFELHMQPVDWLTESPLPCDRGIISNKHSTRKVFLDNGESLVYWRNCWAKVCRPSWTSYIVALCSLFWFLLFPWIY